MNFKKIITVMLISSMFVTGHLAVVAYANNADTVISNQLTQENDTRESNVTSISDVVSGDAVIASAISMDCQQVMAEENTIVATQQEQSPSLSEVVISDPVSGTEDVVEVQDATSASDKKVSGSTKKGNSVKKKYTKAELKLMSCLIFCEASGEPYAGKLAVGIVVMNRKSSKSFPNTVKGVIYQKYQFGPVRNGSLNRALARYEAGKFNSPAEKACIKAAKAALSGEKKVSYNSKIHNMKSYHFFSTRVLRPRLIIKHHQFK